MITFNTPYCNGDKGEYTGKTIIRHKIKWFEFKLLGGHLKGELKVTSECPDCGLAHYNNMPLLNICHTCEVNHGGFINPKLSSK